VSRRRAGAGGNRYDVAILVVVLVVVLGGLWAFDYRHNMHSAPSDAKTNPIQCPTSDSLSCYYVNSNRPVSAAKSVLFHGSPVPVVGLEPPYCTESEGNCPYEGSVGAYVVVQVRDGPNKPSRLEAVYISSGGPAGSTTTSASGEPGNHAHCALREGAGTC
jgi:hypothetical protein